VIFAKKLKDYLINIRLWLSASLNTILAGGNYRMTLSARMGWEKARRRIKKFPFTWRWPGFLFWAADHLVEELDDNHSTEAIETEIRALVEKAELLKKTTGYKPKAV